MGTRATQKLCLFTSVMGFELGNEELDPLRHTGEAAAPQKDLGHGRCTPEPEPQETRRHALKLQPPHTSPFHISVA
jgi:hypothetical protein